MLAGIAGAAFAAWWWRRRTTGMQGSGNSDRGQVIFQNHPIPSSEGIL